MSIRDMLYVAMFTAIVCALGFIQPIYVPFTTVPITAQTLGVMLAGAILGARLGGMSLVLFLLLVLIGAPVLSGGLTGLPVFMTHRGGYILAFPLGAIVVGFLVRYFWTRLNVWKLVLINFFGGALVIYAVAIPYIMMITDVSFTAIAILNLIYIPGDLVKAFIAAVLAMRINRVRPVINFPFDQEKRGA